MSKEKYATRFPYSGTLELTGRCNLNCEMCYVHVDNQRMHELGASELTTEEWKCKVDEIFEAGTMNLLITGGEPLVRSDFVELYEYIAKKGFFLTLYTNATLINDEIFHILKKYPPHIIGITLYGITNQTYKKICGRDRVFNRVLEGINRLITLPSKIEIRSTITQNNLQEAKAIEEYIKSFGKRVTFNINQTIFQSGRCSIAKPEQVRLTPRQNVEFHFNRYISLLNETIKDPQKLSTLRDEAKKMVSGKSDAEFLIDDLSKEKTSEPKGPWGCMAGWQNFTISWQGKLMACQLTDAVALDCKMNSFSEAWNALGDIILEPVQNLKCIQCMYQMFCGICPASRICETGCIDGVPEYFCELAKVYHDITYETNGEDNLY